MHFSSTGMALRPQPSWTGPWWVGKGEGEKGVGFGFESRGVVSGVSVSVCVCVCVLGMACPHLVDVCPCPSHSKPRKSGKASNLLRSICIRASPPVRFGSCSQESGSDPWSLSSIVSFLLMFCPRPSSTTPFREYSCDHGGRRC